ncbi:MAG: DUF3078 domain-containing protein [Balneolaceae bacterium]
MSPATNSIQSNPTLNGFHVQITAWMARFGVVLLFMMTMWSPEAALAQDDLIADEELDGWEAQWNAGLNGSQASYSNWSKGGVNNLSMVTTTQFSTLYRYQRVSYGARIRARYGESRIQDEGVRKIDDRISFRNRFQQELADDEVDFRLFANFNFETQFDKGYDYGAGENGEDVLISRFMAPANFSQNAGLAYVPRDEFAIEAGLGLKQTIVVDTTLSERYGLEPGARLFNEAGFNTGVSLDLDIMENLGYTGYLETFTNLNRHVRRTDVTMAHELTGRINDFLNMSLRFEVLYDDDYSTELQWSQVLSAGLSIAIL